MCVWESTRESKWAREEISNHTHFSLTGVLGLWRLTPGGTKAISEIKATLSEKEKQIIHI